MTRNQMIANLKAKIAAGLTPALPVLSEGETYRMELSASERLVRGTLRPGPAGSLIVMG